MLDKIKRFVDDAFGQVKAHHQKTIDWLEKIYPAADEPMKIAAYAHDIARAERGFDAGRFFQDKEIDDPDYLKEHQEKGAQIVKDFLEKNNYPTKEIQRIHEMIRLHEVGGTKEADLIKDADSLSYFEVNAKKLIIKYGQALGEEKIQKKNKWMLERITNVSAKRLAQSYYNEINNFSKKFYE